MPSVQSSVNKIYIFTGKTGSGKTTFIYRWAADKPGIEGIITLTANGKRILFSLGTKEERIFETDSSFEGPVQKVGKYIFEASAFEWAENIVVETDFSKVKCFVLDEAGILELEEKGFCKAITILLNKIKDRNTDIIIVVREALVEKIIELFDLKNAVLCSKDDFNYTL